MRNPFFHSKRTQSDGVVFTTRKHAALYQQGITSVALTLSSVGVMSYLLGAWPADWLVVWRGWLGLLELVAGQES